MSGPRSPGREPSGPVAADELIGDLSRPAAFPHAPAEVAVAQTHISVLFFAGDRVFKVKKPVDLGFVDFTSLASRRAACEAEVALNAELAPGVYRRVVPIVRGDDGRLRFATDGAAVDWAVEMARLPAEGMLDRLLDDGVVDNELVGALADLLARFHARAATGPGVDEHGSPDAIAFNVRENFAQTAGFAGAGGAVTTFTPDVHRYLHERAEAFLERERPLLERRVADGRIRDGHGDLHAGNVCVTAGRIVVYDRLEFAARLRCGDVACDLAFLAMDLDDRGFRGFAAYLARRYGELTADAELGRLLPFYKGYRAMVRAKVASIAATDLALAPDERERRTAEAMRYASLAAAYELPPALVLMCGLPATGKSTVARATARPFEAVVAVSDRRRKQLAGVPAGRRAPAAYGTGLYAPEMTERTYRALLADAERGLAQGRTVVVDASFGTARARAPFVEVARRLGAPHVVVHVTAAPGEVRARLAARAHEPGSVSDADLAVFERMRETFEPPDEIAVASRLEVRSPAPGTEVALALVDRLVALASGA